MAGVLFLITVPRSEHEIELRKWEKSAKILIEGDKYDNYNKIEEDIKINRKFATLRSKTNREYFARDDNSVILSKCKSTDCLHSSKKEKGLEKSNSETVLREEEKRSLGSEYKNYVKTSWEEIKQTIKPTKQKLKITAKLKHDHLAAFHCDTALETILCDVLKRLHIQTASWSLTKENNFYQVVFSLNSGHLCEEILQVLRTFGIGSRYQSSVSIIPCALYYKKNCENRKIIGDVNDEFCESSWSKFTSSVRSRTNLAQVLHEVRSDAALTFDWLFLLIVAAFVAAIGLVENSTVILVASMLISPLMGPITAGTLGTSLKDRCLQRMGLQHEVLGLFLSLIIGFVFGLAICAVDEHYGVGDWPTNEMMSRCEIRSLWVGVLVAIPSGAGVALAVLGEYTASLVGVAISASLLPPAVNAGLLWAMSLVHLIFMDDDTKWTAVVKTTIYSKNQAIELAALGAVSLCLTLVNIVCIFLAGVAVYKVKEVSPMEPRDLSWWRSVRESTRKFTGSRNHRNDDDSAWEFYRWCQRSEDMKTQNEKSFKSDESNSPTNYSSESEFRDHNVQTGYFQQTQINTEDSLMNTDTSYKSHAMSPLHNSDPNHEAIERKDTTDLHMLQEVPTSIHNVKNNLLYTNEYVNTSLNSADSLEQSLNFNSIVKVTSKTEKANFNMNLQKDGYVSINYSNVPNKGLVLNS